MDDTNNDAAPAGDADVDTDLEPTEEAAPEATPSEDDSVVEETE